MAQSSLHEGHGEHEHQHNNHQFLSTKTCRLLSMLLLTFGFFIVELVVGYMTNSLALIADAFHMLSDVIALVIALVAVRISKRRSDINTYGWVRAEVVGANINTVFLLALCLTIVFDVVKRFITPESIENVNLLLIVGSTGLGINIIGLFLFRGFHGHSHTYHEHEHIEQDMNKPKPIEPSKPNERMHTLEVMPTVSEFRRHSIRALEEVIVTCAEISQQNETPSDSRPHLSTHHTHRRNQVKKRKSKSMNMHGIFLHVLADALGSIVVIISALLIKFVSHDSNNLKHWTIYIDPTLSLIIVTIITISAVPLLKETSFILLQTLPHHIKVDQVKTRLLREVPEIDGIHELHIWRLTDQKIIASAHLKRRTLNHYMRVADSVKQIFHSMGIHSTTIQYEYDNDHADPLIASSIHPNFYPSGKSTCLLSCNDESCHSLVCCADRIAYTDIDQNTTVKHIQSTAPQAFEGHGDAVAARQNECPDMVIKMEDGISNEKF